MQLLCRALSSVPAAVAIMDAPGHGERRPPDLTDAEWEPYVLARVGDPDVHAQVLEEWPLVIAAAREARPQRADRSATPASRWVRSSGCRSSATCRRCRAAVCTVGGYVGEERGLATLGERDDRQRDRQARRPRRAHGEPTSVCTGSIYLAAAGILDGVDATTHWAEERLEQLGARYTEERVVERGKVITAAGVSSGIDMALRCRAVHGPEMAQLIQLAIEYDPQPPFDTGSPTKAPTEIVERRACSPTRFPTTQWMQRGSR